MALDYFGNPDYINSHFIVKQICDVCSKEIFTENPLEKCIVCEKSLCPSCDYHGFCKKDYEALTMDEKTKIENAEQNFSSKNKWRFIGLFGNTIILFVGFILMMVSDPGTILFIVSTVLIILPIIDMFGIIFVYFRSFNRVIDFKRNIFSHHEN
ncbi:hypothetical protein NEF87_004515 [Candidatus Lokiarchaeum ossiferum]|uniref:B box-type domain-containing protein n=1 Tax=Candidatus Lokiarchaeum ossiferum TaxID=2951803 RepID=A0ABY6HXT6_9ARCH|nr:hypothetical protein NEF87_004515 [Candidatus Lokiarchaeum sp. B-35]